MKKHLKRRAIPRSWPIPRKTSYWAMRPRPGPHAATRSLPLGIILRDLLHAADTAKEAQRLLAARGTLVDGRVVTDTAFPVGLMDVVSFPQVGTQYRMLVTRRGRLTLVPVDKAEAAWKLVRVRGKTTVPGGTIQLHLHDGRNLLLKKNAYRTGDTLRLAVPEPKVLDHLPFGPGSMALLTGGTHVGQVARIKEKAVTSSPRANVVAFEEGFTTVQDYVFVVGADASVIKLPEG